MERFSSTSDSTGRYVVAAGDSFWSIAERRVLTDLPEATEQDIARYWLRLIEANREILSDPANPDLLLIGNQLTIPAVVSAVQPSVKTQP